MIYLFTNTVSPIKFFARGGITILKAATVMAKVIFIDKTKRSYSKCK